VFFIIALLFLMASLVSFYFGGLGRFVALACLGISIFVAVQVVVAWIDSRTGPGSGTCPKCGAQNPVRLWSF
jgi:hypothetical protein